MIWRICQVVILSPSKGADSVSVLMPKLFQSTCLKPLRNSALTLHKVAHRDSPGRIKYSQKSESRTRTRGSDVKILFKESLVYLFLWFL